MDFTKELPITRKAAIYKAISLLAKQKNREEEITLLKDLATGMPILQWSDKIAKDCIDDFYIEHDRFPTVTELQKNDELPSHTNFKYLFGMTARQWLDINSKSYVVPKTTRRRALKLASEVLEGEERRRILEMLEEYPITKWNDANMINCFVSFYEKYGRVPSEDEMADSEELPYYGIFRYKWKTTYLNWLKTNIPALYEECLKKRFSQRDYVSEFISEYNRVNPKSEKDFNRRRDSQLCCSSDWIRLMLNVGSWDDLVKNCGLKLFDNDAERLAKERAKIKSVIMIDVDYGESFFYRIYSTRIEKEFEKLFKR